jgi:hypothetical protein
MKNNIQYFDQMKQSPLLCWFDTTMEGEEVTIKGYELIEIELKGGDIEKKWIIYFAEKEKGMILNKTNRNVLSQAFGEEVNESIGKKIILYYRDDIEYQGKLTKGLRLRRCIVKPAVIPIIQDRQQIA